MALFSGMAFLCSLTNLTYMQGGQHLLSGSEKLCSLIIHAPQGRGERVHFHTDLTRGCSTKDEASQMEQHLCFQGHQTDGLGPASLEVVLREFTQETSWGHQPREKPPVSQCTPPLVQRVGEGYSHQASPRKVDSNEAAPQSHVHGQIGG